MQKQFFPVGNIRSPSRHYFTLQGRKSICHLESNAFVNCAKVFFAAFDFGELGSFNGILKESIKETLYSNNFEKFLIIN